MNPDRFTAHLALTILGSLAIATVVGGIVLAFSDRSLPGEIIAIGSGAAGVIGGMFSSLGRTDEPTPVVGPQGGPLEVTPVDPSPVMRTARKRARSDSGLTLIEALVLVLAVAVVLMLLGRL